MRVNYFSLLIGAGFLAGALPVVGQTSAGDPPVDATTQTANITPPAEGRWSIQLLQGLVLPPESPDLRRNLHLRRAL
jgi:hypothetical protein